MGVPAGNCTLAVTAETGRREGVITTAPIQRFGLVSRRTCRAEQPKGADCPIAALLAKRTRGSRGSVERFRWAKEPLALPQPTKERCDVARQAANTD